MINNIKNNTISEALAKQKLNALNEIKKAETKNKRLINGQKILLNLFDDLIKAIFNNKTVSEDNNKTVSKDNNKTVIEYNNIDDDNNDNNDNNIKNDNDNNDNNDKITVKKINNNFKKN